MFDTNSGSKFFVSSIPANIDLDLAGFEALTYIQVKGISNFGETGTNTNIVTYPTWDTEFIQKAKGTSNAGDPDLEVGRIPTDAGQLILRAAGDALNKNNYAFKIERNDAPPAGTPTFVYNRGMVAGPKTPNGQNEDFVLEMYTLALQQQQIIDEASA